MPEDNDTPFEHPAPPPKPLPLGARLEHAYAHLKLATASAFSLTNDVANFTRTLKARKAEILLSVSDPKQLGANADQREAKLAELTQAESTAATEAERMSREAGHRLELANLDVAAALAQLRIAEVAAKGFLFPIPCSSPSKN